MQARRCLKYVLGAALLLAAPHLGAQQVTGRVVDQNSNQPLSAVQISIPGTGVGALSQASGRYLLLNVPIGTHTVSAQRIGYKTVTAQVTVAAGATVVQDFTLAEEALGLDEIVVTGTPGGTQRRAIGNSVVSVKASEITQNAAVSNIQGLLGGRTPGIQFVRASSNVGAGSPVAIRGVGSFNLQSNPLIFVDGMRVNNNSNAGPTLGDIREVNVLNDFNPADIESVEIIKGPAAATLYGTEASAGVIQIITKRGAQGATQFDASIRQGKNWLANPDRIGPLWACKEAVKPPCREGDATNPLISYMPYTEYNNLVHEGAFDWPTKNLFQNGNQAQYDLSARGGTQNVRYFVSASYADQEGIVFYNTDKNFHGRANLSVVFSDAVSLDVSTGYVDGFTQFMEQGIGDGGEWGRMAWGYGGCVPRINGKITGVKQGPGQVEAGLCPRLMGFQEHLPSDVAKVKATREYARFTGSSTLTMKPTSWLTSRAVIGIDKGWDENTNLYPLDVGTGATATPVYTRAQTGYIALQRPITTNLSADWSATAKKQINDAIGTTTSVGIQYYLKRENTFENIGVGFASTASTTINQTPVAKAQINYSFIENKSLGAYIQEEVGLNNRIFVTGAARFDDNSAFGSDYKPKVYPKVSATWTVSDESFWGVDHINQLRLRGAWGAAGRQPQTFAGANQYGVVQGPNGTVAFNPTSPGNPVVGPERSTEIEVGFDAAAFDSRLSAEFSYFYKKTKDALLAVSVAPSIGFGGATQRNLGQLDNWGWEAAIHTRLYETPSVSFGIDFTADHVDNKIVSLGDYSGNNNIRVGWPYPNYTQRYWVTSAQFAPTDPKAPLKTDYGQEVYAMCDPGTSIGDSDPINGLVHSGTEVPCSAVSAYTQLVGPAFQTYNFGATPTLSLFNNVFQIHALFDGGLGKWHKDGGAGAGCHQYNNCYQANAQTDPLWWAQETLGDSRASSLYRGGLIKLREIGARYTLPEGLIGHVGADRASLAFSMREVATLWRQEKYLYGHPQGDPELGTPDTAFGGSNNRAVPPSTTLDITLNVSF